MRKEDLASQLRQRQLERGGVPPEVVASASDDLIIDSYITCNGCGHKALTCQELDQAILLAQDAHDFMKIWPTLSSHKHGAN